MGKNKSSEEPKETQPTTTSTSKPSRFGSPLQFIMNLLLLIMLTAPFIVLCYITAKGPGLERKILPPATAMLVRAIAEIVRDKLHLNCKLGEICTAYMRRPLLEDGESSSAVWDRARYLMKNFFQGVHESNPNAQVNYMWEEPLVVYFDNVLTEEEIDTMVTAADPKFTKSMVVDEDGKAYEDTTRTSDTAWLYTSENPTFERIVKKVTALAGFPSENAEPIGINRYQPSQFFNPHYDYLQEYQLISPDPRRPACQRAITALIYLSDVEAGGETMFARDRQMDGTFAYDEENDNHLAVTPKKGRVLIWYDMHPYTEKIDDRTLHGGSPVKEGTKIAATIFIRNCSQVGLYASEQKQEL